MDIRQIKYFIAVAEEANIGRAAARLHMSQPPLTRQIQQLEDELDTRLFVRTPRGMELTQAGELFLAEARNIRALIEQATERTQRAGQGKLGRLDVAIFGSAILERIPKLILNFRNEYPGVNVVLHTMTKAEQISALRQNRITVGFNRMLAPLPDLRSEVIATESLLLAINLTDPLVSQPSLPFHILAERPAILFPSGARPNFVDKVLGLCESRGFIPEIAQEVGDAVTGVALVASGFGVCVVPESATTLQFPGVAYVPFRDAPADAYVDLSCIYRADDTSPILTTFLTSIRQASPLHGGASGRQPAS